MARVHPEKILEYLGQELRPALEKAVKAAVPGAEFDARALYAGFLREVAKSYPSYEQVPDSCVQT
ncbi:MAG: hypothetical protein H0W83_00855 [Planctomycetes bacterium]|nr:hypothetical protein [Planctomycetota bacterium]